jgi:hypothetical protein
MKKLKINKQLRATFIFNKKTAQRQMDVSYYKARYKDSIQHVFIEREKIRLATR